MKLSPRVKKILRIAVPAGIAVVVGVQFIPVKGLGSNPEQRYTLDAPPEVAAILKRSCFDCHSNETVWPAWSHVAPGSWLMARDVRKGRSHLNMSEWGDTDDDERQTDRENMWDMIKEGEMPPFQYIYPLHLGARLSAAEKETLHRWLAPGKK